MNSDSHNIQSFTFIEDLSNDSKAVIFGKINYQWNGLQDQSYSNMNTAIGRVFLLNSGAAAATLAYLGTTDNPAVETTNSLALVTGFFICGAVLILIWHLIHQIGLGVIIDQYDKDLTKFHNSEISWEELNPTEPSFFVIGGWASSLLSLLFLIVGIIVAFCFFFNAS